MDPKIPRLRIGSWWALPASACCLVLLLLATGALAGGEYVGRETCLECHDDYEEAYARSVHGRLDHYQYPGAATGCETGSHGA